MENKINFEQLTQEILSLFVSHKLNLDMIYYFLNHTMCFYSQAMNKNLDQIKSDIEVIFKSLPPPIEELDDNADKQPNCQGT